MKYFFFYFNFSERVFVVIKKKNLLSMKFIFSANQIRFEESHQSICYTVYQLPSHHIQLKTSRTNVNTAKKNQSNCQIFIMCKTINSFRHPPHTSPIAHHFRSNLKWKEKISSNNKKKSFTTSLVEIAKKKMPQTGRPVQERGTCLTNETKYKYKINQTLCCCGGVSCAKVCFSSTALLSSRFVSLPPK